METINKKPTILTFVAYYLPGYKSGGPVRTIANMVEQLGDEFDFRIVTADRDSFDPKPYPDIRVNEWNQVGKAQVFYISPENRNLRYISRLINGTPHDALYLNSFFNPVFTFRPLLARRLGLLKGNRPVIVAPRGEFSSGALRLKKIKKVVYVNLARWFGLYKAITWHASSEYEAADIQKAFKHDQNRVEVALDLPQLFQPGFVHVEKTTADPALKIVFLSRVSPMKNLDFALDVLSKVKSEVLFNIYGLVDDADHWGYCRQLIAGLPKQIKVRYHGVIPHTDVQKILAAHDLFFLPTRGENFGHVIHEALGSGVPVLISDQTPWSELEKEKVGWVFPLDQPEKFVQTIEAYAQLPPEIRAEMCQRAQDYARRVSGDEKIVEANRRVFLNTLSAMSNSIRG